MIASMEPLSTPREGTIKQHRAPHRGGEVVERLRSLKSTIDEHIIDRLLVCDRVRKRLSCLTKSDGLDAVDTLGRSLQNRDSELAPIENIEGYFLKILTRYKGRGEVMQSLRQLASIQECRDSVSQILSHENISDLQPILSSLSRLDGLEAVQKLGNSLKDRASRDLDPIHDPVGYFHKILSRYTPVNDTVHRRDHKRRRVNEGSTNYYNEDEDDNSMEDDENEEDYQDDDINKKLRKLARQTGRYKSNYLRSEERVKMLEAELSSLTSSLEETTAELYAVKNELSLLKK